MNKPFFFFRQLCWVSIICSLIGSAIMFAVGAMKTFNAFKHMFLTNMEASDQLSTLQTDELTTIYLIMSLDAFLIGMVLFIFSYGIYKLFINNEVSDDNNSILSWIQVKNISQLKNTLAEVIVIILFVKFLELALESIFDYKWEDLILPISILLLAASLKLLNLRGVEKSE